jgi:hypothetical protein
MLYIDRSQAHGVPDESLLRSRHIRAVNGHVL